MTLFPCVGYSKVPARKGFLDLPFDPEFMPEDHNYGVLLRQRFLVIDCDPRAYADNDKPLTRMLAALGLPADLFKQTFTVKTPRGGYHIYFSKPENVSVVNSLKEFPGLEFKTKFIMACGSYIDKTEKGEEIDKQYTAVYGTPAGILKAPQILLALLLKKDMPAATLDGNVVPDNEADISNFIQYCRSIDPAVENNGGDLKTYVVACRGRDMGLSQAKTLALMAEHFNPRCDPPWDREALAVKVQNAYTYSTRNPQGVKSVQNDFPDALPKTETQIIRYQFEKGGAMKKSLANLKMFFEFPTVHSGKEGEKKRVLNIPPIGNLLRYNQMTYQIDWGKPAPWYKSTAAWSDEDAVEFKMILSDQLAVEFPVAVIHEAAYCCASKRAYHPVREYLEKCVWDGVPRLDNWLARYCGAIDSEYSRYIGRKTLIAAVARVFSPGCKFDHVLVTEGLQGVGKSFMWETLASPWFTDAPLQIHDKAAVEVIHGKWVVELAEMDALSKYESQTMKGFFTRTEDRCRMAYDRNVKNFPRQNIFVGTINPEQTGWLRDHTGNRRYWPIEVVNINLKELKKVRDELWAEALLAFQKGEIIHVDDPNMQAIMRAEVGSRMQEDPWFALIESHLHEHGADFVVDGHMVVTPVELYTRLIGGNAAMFKLVEASRIASVLKILGFEKSKSPDKIGYVYKKKWVESI